MDVKEDDIWLEIEFLLPSIDYMDPSKMFDHISCGKLIGKVKLQSLQLEFPFNGWTIEKKLSLVEASSIWFCF